MSQTNWIKGMTLTILIMRKLQSKGKAGIDTVRTTKIRLLEMWEDTHTSSQYFFLSAVTQITVKMCITICLSQARPIILAIHLIWVLTTKDRPLINWRYEMLLLIVKYCHFQYAAATTSVTEPQRIQIYKQTLNEPFLINLIDLIALN